MRHRAGSLAMLLGLLLLVAACGGSGDGGATATPDQAVARPLPSPVQVRPDPDGVQLDDPTFDPLPGARAYYGRLGGTVYQVEVPDNWNGRLLLYMHGFQGLDASARVDPPLIRPYLIRNGYAWGASSFSSTSLIPGRAADETAALWDWFAAKFGRPRYTYVTGHSMGGGATNIAAERYGDRYDGALSLCGFAGQTAETNVAGNFFLAAAYVAGVTQPEFDAAAGDVNSLIDGRIMPALADPAAHQRFENILLDLTGGPRAFDDAGFRMEEDTNWWRARILVAAALVDNRSTVYHLGALSGISDDDFNRGVLRLTPNADLLATFNAGNELTGQLEMPMLSLHTTGDGQVPVDEEQVLRRTVAAAGKADLLVQRLVQAPEHCGFTNGEWEQGLEDLVAWVERGVRPQGEDVLVSDLTHAGEKFTLTPRVGSPQADNVPGAGERVTLTGTAVLDGKPLDTRVLGVAVERDGVFTDCTFSLLPISGGSFRAVVPGQDEMAGCGAPGARIHLYASAHGHLLFSPQVVDWPASGGEVSTDATFSSADPGAGDATVFFGDVFGSDGKTPTAGTAVEAYAGGTLCGRATIPAVARAAFVAYVLLAGGPGSACPAGADLTFRVAGKDVEQTEQSALDGSMRQFDLVEPP